MAYWIFKVSSEGEYPDVPGSRYVYDNRHSVRVKPGDEFVYLEKKGSRYGLTGAGRVSKVTGRTPTREERRSPKVRRIFSAHLEDMVWFPQVFDLAAQTRAGAENRARTGLPRDLNTIGWSISMPQIGPDLFVVLLDAALATSSASIPDLLLASESDWHVADAWSLVRKRQRMHLFRIAVLSRHNYTCLFCGCRLRSVLDVAHIRSYASSEGHRANPANGMCLCRFCHAAFDAREVSLNPDGKLVIMRPTDDPVALAHFTGVTENTRNSWMHGIDPRFLLERATPQLAQRNAIQGRGRS